MKKPLSKKALHRIEVAKDVIAQLKSKRYIADVGNYVDADDLERGFDKVIKQQNKNSYEDKVELQCVINESKHCEVCAEGGLFLSTIRLFNNFKTSYYDLPSNSDNMKKLIEKRLLKNWSSSQIRLIELAFEEQEVDVTEWDDINYKTRRLAESFGERNKVNGADTKTSKKRMIAIMENIIQNDGTFNP